MGEEVAMTLAELLEVVYRFNPRGLHQFSTGYDDTEERRRQRAVAQRAVAEVPTWKAMLRRLQARYPVTDHSVHVLGKDYAERAYDPAYEGSLDTPEGHTLEFQVSLLGPYYGIRCAGAGAEDPAALDLAREIEATYPGYERIPPELGDEIVPDVGSFGSTTVYHCLLSEAWPSPKPLPPLPSPDEVLARRAERERHGGRFLWGDSEQVGEAGPRRAAGDEDDESGGRVS